MKAGPNLDLILHSPGEQAGGYGFARAVPETADHNRLGFALQVVTVRYLGMFRPDPLEVPPELVGYLAEQLGCEFSNYLVLAHFP